MENEEKKNNEEKSLKENWAEFGKGMGKSFAGLGKSIVKSAKVGLNKMDGTATDEEKKELKESWSNVGHTFGHTGASLGRAAAKTADTVADKIDSEDNK